MTLVETIITHIQAKGRRSQTLYGKHGWFILDDALYKAVAAAVIQYEKSKPRQVENVLTERVVVTKPPPPKPSYDEDVVHGLMNLGYKERESIQAATGITGGTIEERMTKALQKLGE